MEKAVSAAVERFGAVKLLINNAGIAAKGDVTPTDDEAFDRVLAVVVAGYFHIAKAAMPQLRERRGAIVMTSSVFGLGCDRGSARLQHVQGRDEQHSPAVAIRDKIRHPREPVG